MLELNYKEKLSKMKNLIQIWKRRYLTPLGKITVIKSILISLLTHLFISLPNPTSSIIKQLKTMLLDFLWEGPPKIKQNVLVKDYSEGGLKMINIDAFIKGLKATWIRRLIISNSKWQYIIKSNLNIKDLINFGKSYSESLIKQINNPFWSDVVKSYSSVIQLKEKNTTEYFLSSPIFHNPEILIGKQTIFYQQWYNKGICYINGMFKENGEFYTELEFVHKYNIKTNFLQFNGLKVAIKVFAKKLKLDTIRNKLSNPMLPTNISVFLRSAKGSKDLYNILNQNNYTQTSKEKWQEIYDIEEETWKDIYSAPFKQTCSTKLQWFQVSIIHRLLPTKKYLYNIKAVDSPNCNFCYQEETIPHMLWSCPETFLLIQHLNQWLSATNTYTNNVEELFIFNIGKNIEEANQQIILETKYYIYLTK